MTRRFMTILAIFLAFTLVGTGTIEAQAASPSSGLHLVTSPLPIDLVAKPGTTISTELKVRNAGSQTETLKMGLLKFSAYGDSGSPRLEDRQPGDDYFDWVTFNPAVFTVAPDEWKTISMTIAVPKTAAFGYYYAVTFSRAKASGVLPVDKPETSLVGATAALILLEAQVPNAKRALSVEQFSTDHPWYEFLPVTFTTKLRNSGNVHVVPHGNIFIEQGTKAVASLHVNEGVGNILPNSVRSFTSIWDDGFPHYTNMSENGKVVLNAQGIAKQHLQWDFSQGNHLRFGHYTAHLVMVYDDGKRDVPIEATIGFWVIPWRFILALSVNILIIVGFFGLIATFIIRRRRRTV